MKTERRTILSWLAASVLVLALGGAWLHWSGSVFSQKRTRGVPVVVPNPSISAPLSDSNQAVGHLSKREPQPKSAESITAATTNALLRNLNATLQAIQIETDVAKREAELSNWVNSIPITEVPTVLRFLNDHSAELTNLDLAPRLIGRWAESDPRAAAEWVSGRPVDSEHQKEINAVAVAWASQDLSDAIGWARQLPDETERQSALVTIAYEAGRTEPMQALKLAMS
jgi:hypothetical protein